MQKEGYWIHPGSCLPQDGTAFCLFTQTFQTCYWKQKWRIHEEGRPLVLGVWALRLLGKKAKEREQLLPFSGFVFQILERITEVLEKVPAGTTPNVSNYYSEHSLTIKNMLCWAVFGRYQSKAHFLTNEQGGKPQLWHLCSSGFFSLGKYCFKLLFVLIMD